MKMENFKLQPIDDAQLMRHPFNNELSKTDPFAVECAKMAILHEKKNADYGGAFDKSMDEFGPMAAVIRMTDKLNRFRTLIELDEAQVKDESIMDTLRDLACYSIMTLNWINDHNAE